MRFRKQARNDPINLATGATAITGCVQRHLAGATHVMEFDDLTAPETFLKTGRPALANHLAGEQEARAPVAADSNGKQGGLH